MPEKVNLQEKFSLFSDYWNPRVAGKINNFQVRLVKLKGEFVWHHHDVEDELFLVVKGQLQINLRDQDSIVLNEGEFVIIPHGVEHQPVAEEECHVMLLEPEGTLNTGNIHNERTVEQLGEV